MKTSHISVLAVWVLGAAALATDPTPQPPATPGAAAGSSSPKPSVEYTKLFNEAAALFRERDLDGALARLDQADKLMPNSVAGLTLRGGVYVEQKNFAAAAECYKKAIAADPKNFAPKFNMAELVFMDKRYAESRKMFEKLVEEYPTNELLNFKIFLTYLMEGDTKEAQVRLDAMKFPSDTAAYYFAHAAWEFKQDDNAKGMDWVKSGDRIFGRARTLLLHESLADLGWLPRPTQPKVQLSLPPTDGVSSAFVPQPPPGQSIVTVPAVLPPLPTPQPKEGTVTTKIPKASPPPRPVEKLPEPTLKRP